MVWSSQFSLAYKLKQKEIETFRSSDIIIPELRSLACNDLQLSLRTPDGIMIDQNHPDYNKNIDFHSITINTKSQVSKVKIILKIRHFILHIYIYSYK